MRIAALVAVSLFVVLACAPATRAQEAPLQAEFCNIKTRVSGGMRHCTGAILRKDIAAGRVTVVFQFTDGFRLEIEGAVFENGPHASTLNPEIIRWANPGQSELRVDTGAGGAGIRGRCTIARFRGAYPVDGAVYCRIAGALGRMNIEFKAVRPTEAIKS